MCLPGSERYLPDLIAVGENRLHRRRDGTDTVIEQKMHGYTYCQEIIDYAKKFVEDIFSDSVSEGPVTL